MITLKEYLFAIEYRVTEGSEFGWKCYGSNARYLDCIGPTTNQDYSIHAIFDSQDQRVYAMEAWDYKNDREYRWIDPEYVEAHKLEAKTHNIDPDETLDGEKYIDLEVPQDMLEKINAIVNGKTYDDRVQVPVEFSDDDLLQYMKLAHELDITFNELVERAIKEAVDAYERNPEEFKQKADKFIKENYELGTDGC